MHEQYIFMVDLSLPPFLPCSLFLSFDCVREDRYNDSGQEDSGTRANKKDEKETGDKDDRQSKQKQKAKKKAGCGIVGADVLFLSLDLFEC
jgi:hypothetical protein